MTGLDHEIGDHQTVALDWRDGTPVSRRFDDPYFSVTDGLAECRHVFLTGNDLPGRLKDGFHVAELGFGTGLNLLALLAVVPEGARVKFTTFEAYPMAGSQAARALRALAPTPLWGDRIDAVAELLDTRRPSAVIGPAEVDVIWGDARQTLPKWRGCADAWFLDGFSPARNPQMWGEQLMLEVARHTRKGGTFATFTAAGAVRRALERGGFEVQRTQGFGRKRHMSRGTKK